MKMKQWQMTEPRHEFKLVDAEWPSINEHQALVKVAGCGVCHTDLGFWMDGVRTKKELPITLGHEISGWVVEGPAHLLHQPVIIPAVLPCGECELCRQGRSNICQHQVMPGNDIHGGFASHIVVPHQYLCPVPESIFRNYSLEQLSVIADAISTPYQVMKKSELVDGDLAIVIGIGGVGMYGALLAKLSGAKVLAIDISEEKLAIAKQHGIDAVLHSQGLDVQEIKTRVRKLAADLQAPLVGWKIFEMSGSAAGQELAFNLITFTSTLSIVGFTKAKIEVRLSNLMAFDAKLIGTWGCKPELYPEVVALIDSGQLKIHDFIQTFPMSAINDVFKNTAEHRYSKRSVLVADFNL